MPLAFDHRVQALRTQFLDSLPQQAHQLENLWHQLRHTQGNETHCHTFQSLVHRLVGSSASFGFSDIGSAAQLLETYLVEHEQLAQPMGGIEFEMIDQMVDALVRTLVYVDTADTPALVGQPKSVGEGKRILIIDSDPVLSALTTTYLEAAGFKAQHFESPAACIPQLPFLHPHAILIDPCLVGDGAQGFKTLEQLKTKVTPQLPIIFLSARTDIKTRLRALRIGCSHFVTKPIEFTSLVSTLTQAINNNTETHKVMIVDDEPLIANFHAEILRHAGMEVLCVTEPLSSLEKVAEFKPDLVILDMHMPDINGIELATLLRQDDQFLLLPIIFVTADTSVSLRQSIESLGVNGMLTKPVDYQALINTCERAINDTFTLKQRIERVTQRAQRNNQITRSYFFSQIEIALQETQSHETPAALYYIGLDIPAKLYDDYGSSNIAKIHEQFCQALSQVISSEEQWTDLSNFIACALTHHRTREQHQQRMEQIATSLSSTVYCLGEEIFTLTAKIGVHCLDTETGSANTALLHAEQAYLLSLDDEFDFNHDFDDIAVEEDEFPLMHQQERLPQDNLCISYQPMISLENQRISHYEAIVRWRADEDELIPAAKFLEYIAHSTLRIDVDHWIVESAINDLIIEPHSEDKTHLFIELATDTLEHDSFLVFIDTLTQNRTTLSSKALVFLFDEVWVKDHLKQTQHLIAALKANHCGACLSNTGLTAGCETILHTLMFDYLRLTPALVNDVTANSEHEQRLSHIINTAKEQQAQLIATHVEDPKSLSALWTKGIRLFQGFLAQETEHNRTMDTNA